MDELTELLDARFKMNLDAKLPDFANWLVDARSNTYLNLDSPHDGSYKLFRHYTDKAPDEPEFVDIMKFPTETSVIDYFGLIPLVTCSTQGKRCHTCHGLIDFDEKYYAVPKTELDSLVHYISIDICSDCYRLAQEFSQNNLLYRLRWTELHRRKIPELQQLHRIAQKRFTESYYVEKIAKFCAQKVGTQMDHNSTDS